MTYPFGIDISRYQYSSDGSQKPDFDKMNATCDFVAVRAGISWGYIDPWFRYSWEHISVPRLAYHVIYPGESGERQADHFLNIVKPGKHDRLVLDLELDHGYYKSKITDTVLETLEYIWDNVDFGYPVIYSRALWLNEHIHIDMLPKGLDYWLANYLRANPAPQFTPEMTPPPLMPNGIDTWFMHQTGEKGDGSKVGVVSHYVDTDRFNGTKAELLAYFGLGEETPEPEPPVEVEDKLFDAKVTTTPPNRLKTRYTPNGAERPKVDWLQSQAIVPVYETHSTGWWRVAPEAWSSATWMERVEDKLLEPQEPLFQARVYSWATPYVNVRAEPSLSAGKVGFKYPLAVTDVMSTVPDWYEVPEGWMMSRFLERLDYDPPATMLAIKPLSQRDTRWASHKLGYSYYTIGGYGCLITAISMILNWYGKQTDPAQLNDALVRVGGFTGANLYWNAIAQVQPDIYLAKSIDCYYIPAPLNEIDALLADDVPVLVHVDFNLSTPAVEQHWVLIVGKSGGDYIINDPWTGEQGSFRTRYGDPARWIFRIRAYRRQA